MFISLRMLIEDILIQRFIQRNLFFYAQLSRFTLAAQAHCAPLIAAKLATETILTGIFFVFAFIHFCLFNTQIFADSHR